MVIGVTGLLGAGKDEVAKFFVSKGFYSYSLSDELRAILRERGEAPQRDALFRLGNELRARYGTGYLASRVRQKLKRPAVVTSIRNPGEVEEFRKDSDFALLNVVAPLEMRYERLLRRGREGEESLTLEEFRMKEARELEGSETGQQLGQVAAMADFVVENDSTLEALHEKLEQLYEILKKRYTKKEV
jgi:dephospho-CoA kinase